MLCVTPAPAGGHIAQPHSLAVSDAPATGVCVCEQALPLEQPHSLAMSDAPATGVVCVGRPYPLSSPTY